MWMGRTHPLLTSVRASWMEDGGEEGGDHEDEEQQEDERHPVRDDHKGRMRSVNALPGDYHSYHIILYFRVNFRFSHPLSWVFPT